MMLPLLFYHCERSPRGIWVFKAFLASCIAMVLVSCLVAVYPELSAKLYFSRGEYQAASGIFVKNYIDQSQEFALCAVALVYPVMALWHAGKRRPAILLAAMAMAFVLSCCSSWCLGRRWSRSRSCSWCSRYCTCNCGRR